MTTVRTAGETRVVMVRCVCSKRVGVGLTDMSNHHTDKLHDIVLSNIIAVYNNVEACNEEYYMQSERENFIGLIYFSQQSRVVNY